MLVVIFCVWFIFEVRSEVPLPQSVQVDRGLLTWESDSGLEDTSFTVLQRSLRSESWTVVSSCFQTNATSCNVASITADGGPECVQLAVREETRGENSEVAIACSAHGGACTPLVRLLGAPGAITIQLSRTHRVIEEHGLDIKHVIYFGEEGAPLEPLNGIYLASTEKSGLVGGRNYCASVQFTFYGRPVGLPSCAVCERVPDSNGKVSVIVGCVLLVLFFFSSLVAYFILFQRQRIKKCLHMPYHIPAETLEPLAVSVMPNTSVEERYDNISTIGPI
ncbi:interferon gamma receptor 2 [Synchiropus picturatus]